MRKLVLLSVVFLMFVFLFTCTPNRIVPEKLSSDVPITSRDASKVTWEKKWEGILQGAKKEGVLTVYSTAGNEIRNALTQPLQEKFGVRLEFISGKGSEISQRLFSERRAGIHLADIYIGGATTIITQMKPASTIDFLEPEILLPEVLDSRVWYGGGLRWIDKDKLLLAFVNFAGLPLTINTSAVNPEEFNSYRSLLNPKWKGKIVMNDPTVAGAGEKFFLIVGGIIMGYDYLRELVKQEPVILRDQRQQVEWVAHNKYPIGVTTQPEQVAYFQRAGSPLAYVTPTEGTWMTAGIGNIALINKAAHPRSARLFINWLLTKEGQTLFSKAYGSPSGRLDVSTDGLDQSTLIRPGVKYIPGDTEELLLKTSEERKVAIEIFGPLMK